MSTPSSNPGPSDRSPRPATPSRAESAGHGNPMHEHRSTDASPAGNREGRQGRSPVQWAALLTGLLFLVVGIAGFIPGLTSNYDSMEFAGHHSEAMLLDTFQVSVLHNAVHLLFGIAGLALASRVSGARNFLRWGGVIYLLLWLYGLFVESDSAANFVPLNDANNWLHLILGLGMILLSFLRGHHPERDTVAGHNTGIADDRGSRGPRGNNHLV